MSPSPAGSRRRKMRLLVGGTRVCKSMLFRQLTAVSLTVCAFLFLASVVYPQPKIEFDETAFDWGEMNEGQTVTHDFRFKNTGSKVLEIEKVKSS
jgi:hypothetical protein